MNFEDGYLLKLRPEVVEYLLYYASCAGYSLRDNPPQTNSDILFLPSTCLPLYRANCRVLFPYAFTEHSESILYCIWYIKSISPNFQDNPNSPECEQRSAPTGSDSRGSTVSEEVLNPDQVHISVSISKSGLRLDALDEEVVVKFLTKTENVFA
ncbi:hypothetical protein AVEN_148857-1 [Araneus ventricosus]|uniref:Uncharacterized protein n=1 Tax=Araneus ventricosus TaxID=182803 RepID=A0A4Y2RDY0_ARAVE|nr:hypothetical protein AVEN_149658-1 [Araneus ventricosus]GBN73670.1 hypothetical protein AVEN_148857-1 [Araneus ventricosus]